jgi:hypothetical protein
MKLEKKFMDKIAENVRKNLEEDFIEAGQLLKIAQEIMPDEFRRVVKASGIGLRKAYYLIQIAQDFAPYDVDPGRLKAIGWTKLSMIGPRLTPETYADLIAKAEQHTAYQLAIVLAGEPAPKTKILQIYLTPKNYEIVSKALIASGAMLAGGTLLHKEEALVNMAWQVMEDVAE